jgi:hypothetical protein
MLHIFGLLYKNSFDTAGFIVKKSKKRSPCLAHKSCIFAIVNWKQRIKLVWPRYQKLILDYPVDMKPRYANHGQGHGILKDIIAAQQKEYLKWASVILKFQKEIHEIPQNSTTPGAVTPFWRNHFLPGLDMVFLYTVIRNNMPSRYIEIGSGNSTKVAYKAKTDQGISMKMISIDPHPRAEIDTIVDEVIRQPFEQSSWKGWQELSSGDIVFVDNSHRVFPNSDAMVFFMEILPILPPGVLVHVHDIYWPYDYPQEMCNRFYNEQYLLAAFLMANPQRYQPYFPAYYFSTESSLNASLDPLWDHPSMEGVERHGGSFWIKIGE